MKTKLKKASLILLILVIAFSATLMTACDSNKSVQAFYDYAVKAKSNLDLLAEETRSIFYTITYNPGGYDLDVYTDIAIIGLNAKRTTVKNDYTTLKELFNATTEETLHIQAKAVIYAFEDYANCVFEMDGSYNTFVSNKTRYEKALRDALMDLELALSK